MESDSPHLAYAPPSVPRFSVLSVIALGLAIGSLVIPCLGAWILFMIKWNTPAIRFGVSPAYYAIPLASIICSFSAVRNRKKFVPIAAIILSAFAATFMWYLTSRSW